MAEHRGKRMRIALPDKSKEKGSRLEDDARFGLEDDSRLKISNQINDGFNRRNLEFLQTTFESHKDPKSGTIVASSLESALISLGVFLHTTEIGEILKSRGVHDDSGLDFENFKSIASMPSPIEEWVRALPLNELVADAMPKTEFCLIKDQLRHLGNTTQEQLKVSCDLIAEHVAKILADQIAILKDAMEPKAASDINDNPGKFQICKMDVGDIRNFHEGLASRIGKMRC
jgi:hypothetical protein